MRNAVNRRNLVLIFTSVAATAAFAQAEKEAPHPPSTALEEIVVTAQKREEKLSNVPAVVNAISAATIETLGITKVDDYIGLAPNVTQISQGATGNSAIVIRGMNTGIQSLTSTTAYYLDDTVLSASAFTSGATLIAPDVDLADIERIEILKGPQGTLYGANSLGGILRVISKKPDPTEWTVSARGDFSSTDGGGTGYGARGSLNIPVVQDRVAVRLNAFRRQDPGYYDNVGTGHSDVNEAQVKGGRIAIRILPADRWTVDLSGLYQSIDAGQGIEYDNQVTFTPAFGAYKYSDPRDLANKTIYRTLDSTVSYQADYGTFTAVASRANYETQATFDYTFLYAPFISLFAQPGATSYGTYAIGDEKTTAEMRFASNRLGRFEFLLGGFYTKEDDHYRPHFPVRNPDGSTPAAFGGELLFSPLAFTYKESAGFTNVTYYLTDNIDVTGGFRYSKNEQHIDSINYGFFATFFPNAVYGFDDSAKNYLATVRWRPNDTTNLYLRAASGYRPGGPNIGSPSFPPAKADTVWSYEGGIKGNIARSWLYYDFALYHVNWQNVQLPGQDPVSSSQIVTNGGSAHVDGAELETTVRPLEGLGITVALGYNRTKLVSVAPDVTNVIGAVKGDPFPFAPRWTASLVADYSRPLTDEIEGQIGATFKGVGSSNSSFPGDKFAGNVSQPSTHTLDLRLGARIAKRYRIAARLENVTNRQDIQTYQTSRLFPGQPGVYSNAIRLRPRTFILSGEVNF